MEFHRKQRFSIRKYAIGVASVLIGLALVGPMVAADTVTSEDQALQRLQWILHRRRKKIILSKRKK